MVAVPGMRPDTNSNDFRALIFARDYLYNFVEWETSALLEKGLLAATSPQQYMTEEDRIQFVRDYMALVRDIQTLDGEIQNIYISPDISNPDEASAPLRAERDQLRELQQERQTLAEAIVEAQVSGMLNEYGFGAGSQPIPPVTIRFTQLPTLLIISPRDHIERIGSYPLTYGITIDEMEEIEARVEQELDTSALIVPIGGLGTWPAMLLETSNTAFLFKVSAHEWAHHYLSLYPLGFSYGVTPELFTINETVASIIGNEIGWAVLDRYYPDLAPEPPDYTPRAAEPNPAPAPENEAPVFDFRAEMYETRVRADELLAAGKILEAEQYMEERRIMFVEQGYRLRKINQAYFAFHGIYADRPGASGSDPIGPRLLELRYYSDSLYDFVRTVRTITSTEDMLTALEREKQ